MPVGLAYSGLILILLPSSIDPDGDLVHGNQQAGVPWDDPLRIPRLGRGFGLGHYVLLPTNDTSLDGNHHRETTRQGHNEGERLDALTAVIRHW